MGASGSAEAVCSRLAKYKGEVSKPTGKKNTHTHTHTHKERYKQPDTETDKNSGYSCC